MILVTTTTNDGITRNTSRVGMPVTNNRQGQLAFRAVDQFSTQITHLNINDPFPT